MSNKCDCKHATYCNLNDPTKCKVEEEYRSFNQDRIMNYTTAQIAEMQGRKGSDLKK